MARLTAPPPLHAPPGRKVRVAWTLSYVDERGKRRPFNGGYVFVRLLSASGGALSTAFAAEPRPGRYVARVTVPKGGIGGIQIGIRGTRCDQGGCAPSDLLFPITNDPFRAPRHAAAPPR